MELTETWRKWSLPIRAEGIDAIAELPLLRKLTLSAFAMNNGLGFIAASPSLTQLTLIMGGLRNLESLANATIEMLQILHVGLGTLGDLS